MLFLHEVKATFTTGKSLKFSHLPYCLIRFKTIQFGLAIFGWQCHFLWPNQNWDQLCTSFISHQRMGG